MTLALYGKTRRRQGGLILAGLLAVFAAMLFAIASMGGGRDAQALTLGSANGTWNNAVDIGSGSCPPTGEGTSAINWGNGSGAGCGLQSGYLWQGVTGPLVFSPGVDFPLGKFTHFNNPITGNSLVGASLGLNLAFTDPVQNVPITFLFNHDETPNQAPCAYGATNGPCDDRVTVTNPLNPTFQVGENLYTLTITGFRGVPNNNNACPATPPPGNVNQFVTAESATNRACIYAQLTFVAPIIDINKTTPNATVTPPFPVVYDIAVTNNGGATATNVTFTDALPQGLTWEVFLNPPSGMTCNINTAPNPDVLTCTIASLAPASAMSVTLRSSPTSDALCGPYPNTASITSPGHGTDSDSETVTVTCPTATRTIRVVKVTDSVGHPGETFGGSVTPGASSPSAWSETLSAGAANSGAGDSFTVSTAAHTVDETTFPANWAESGYYQAADTGSTLCSTTPGQYSGAATVLADTGNVLVCVRNTYTAPTRTIRVVKVTDSVGHPGGTFSGTIAPGGSGAANQTWSQDLAASAANSGGGEINTVSTAAHTVDETTIPANWAESGYYQVADTGSTLCSTTAGNYTGSSIVVGAGVGNVLVCVRNTYTEPTRTIRVVKVTNTAVHPGGAFAGTISPGGVAPNNAWAQSLGVNGANSGAGEINTVSTAAHTVDETTIPANWAESGYYQVADTGSTLCSTTAGDYTGSSIVVGAGVGNVLVCVRNTYTEPTRTIRVVKVTNTAVHPGGAFAGTISPGGAAPNNAWAQSLGVNGANSGAGEINTVSATVAHTVDETTIPANWAESGYYQVADTGSTLCSTTAGDYTGSSIVVGAGAGNVLVCVRNTYTEPTRTVRVQKVTATATHPGGTFAGTILPGGTNGDTAWSETLGVSPDFNSAPGETFITLQTAQTVQETSLPGNWVNAGYFVTPDTSQQCSGTETYGNAGGSAAVPAGPGNYLVCVRNAFVAPLPTVSKVVATPSFDATYAYYQIIIDNSAANSIERDGIVITDDFTEAQLVSTTGSGTCGGPLPLAGPWTCNDVSGGQTFTLNIRIPLDANPDGVTSCGNRQIDNIISSATMAGIPLVITDGGPFDPVRVEAPATASADCITITKVNTGNGTWTVVFANTGPAATVNMMDTYQPFVDGTDNINTVTYQAGGANVPGCTGFQSNLVQNCAPLIAGGDPFDPTLTTILVTTDPVSIQCGSLEVINTVSFTYNGSPAETAFDNWESAGTDCAVPTVSKAAATPAFDGTYAYFQIVIDNDFPNAAPRNDIVVTDSIPQAELTSTSGSGACTPATGVGPWDCDGIAAQATLTLNVRVPITVAGTDACLDRTITNDVTAVLVPTTTIAVSTVVPGTAAASCLSLVKTNTGNGTWTIEIHNTGPATTVALNDTYVPFEDDVIENVAGCTSALVIAVDELSFTCSVSVLAADGDDTTPEATVTVTTTALPTGTCEGGGSSNSVTGFFGSSTGPTIGTSSDTQTVPVAPGACTVTVNLCKQWTTEPGEQVVGGQEDFRFTVGSNPAVFINDVEEDGAEECVSLSVTIDEFGQTGLLVREDGIGPDGDMTGFATPLVSINGLSPATSFSVDVPLSQCVQVGGSVSQIIALVRSISLLVVVEPPPPSTDPDCTVLFVNDDTENNLPTGNIQVEKYRDNNGDGDANDVGEGVIPGWQMTTTCPNDPTNVSDTDGAGIVFIPGLNEAQSCTVTEELPAGWQVTRVTVNGANMGDNTSASVTVPGSGATAFVRFYNRELGGITAHKTTVNVVNGIETVNTNDDDGWTITVVSEDCDIDLELDTNSSGNAVFSGLPMCTDYVVSEVPGSGAPGYTPVGPISVSPVTPTVGGNTQVNFTNETRSTTPPCPDCSGGTPTPSPTPPTATPGTPTATATPGTPTVPPASPTTGGTNTPTPVSTAAGERTPGPGQTPVPPSTGDGGSAGAPGGNVLLILVGLGALAGGIAFMAMGRKHRG